MRIKRLFLSPLVLILLLVAGCQKAVNDATPVSTATASSLAISQTKVLTATTTPSPTSTSTFLPTHTATPQPTATSSPTMTATSVPSVALLLLDAEGGEAIPSAAVQLVSAVHQSTANEVTDDEGWLRLTGLEAGTYTLSIALEQYQPAQVPVVVTGGEKEIMVDLSPLLYAEVMVDRCNLRGGPGPRYAVLGTASTGQKMLVQGKSESEEWLVVQTDSGQEAWISITLVEMGGDLGGLSTVVAPPTPTPAPYIAVSVPAAAPPAGPNMLYNPDFELGTEGWSMRNDGDHRADLETCTTDIYPPLVRNGRQSICLEWLSDSPVYQKISGVTPGQTYRFGAWARYWSSTWHDREVSEDPGDAEVYVCINPEGEDDRWLENTVCSVYAYPLDKWEYLSVDAVALADEITVLMVLDFHHVWQMNRTAAFDDAYFGLAPVSATPTPVPEEDPVRPEPVPFDAVALRDQMLNARSMLEQLGGLLDRLVRGEISTCEEYKALHEYHKQLVLSATYHSVPADWQGIYNDYVWSVEHGISTNQALTDICKDPKKGGTITWLNFGAGRIGVNDSLSRLIPVVEAAGRMLEGAN